MRRVIPQHQLRGMRVQMDLLVNQRGRPVAVRGCLSRVPGCAVWNRTRGASGSRGTAPRLKPASPVRSGADLQGDRDAPDAGPGKARSGAEYLLGIVSGRMRSPQVFTEAVALFLEDPWAPDLAVAARFYPSIIDWALKTWYDEIDRGRRATSTGISAVPQEQQPALRAVGVARQLRSGAPKPSLLYKTPFST